MALIRGIGEQGTRWRLGREWELDGTQGVCSVFGEVMKYRNGLWVLRDLHSTPRPSCSLREGKSTLGNGWIYININQGQAKNS